MGFELWLATGQAGDGAHRHDFPVGMTQVVPGKDVAEQMGFQVIVCLRSKGIIEGLPGKPGLDLGALLQRIIVCRDRIGFAAGSERGNPV